jgi:hypothetical protein
VHVWVFAQSALYQWKMMGKLSAMNRFVLIAVLAYQFAQPKRFYKYKRAKQCLVFFSKYIVKEST